MLFTEEISRAFNVKDLCNCNGLNHYDYVLRLLLLVELDVELEDSELLELEL